MTTERLDIVVSERGARRVSRDIAKIGTSARVAQGGVKLLRSALGGLAGALVLRGIVRVLASFSQSMATLKAITQTTGAEFDKLREKAKSLGIQTRFSATQAADAMVFLARTGFTANQVLATIQGTLNLAQIGLIEVARAADIASNVLKGFKLNVSEMERVVDVLAITSVRANVTVESLGDAMSFAASAAAALGVSVEDTAAAIGVLGDRAIPGSRAGAGLNLVFAKMVVLTAAAKRALKEMGLGVEAVDIKSRGLIPVLESLADKNLTLRQAIGLVGVRQAKTLLIIADSVPRMKELAAEYESGAISALELSRIMDDNLNGALIRITSAAQGVIIALGDIGTESALRSGLEGLGAVLRAVARNIEDVIQGFTVLAVGFAFTKITAAINLITAAVVRLSKAILLNPLGALATAAVVATAALVTFKDEVKLTEDGAVTFGDAWKVSMDILGGIVTDTLNAVGGDFIDFGAVVERVTRALANAFLLMVSLVKAAAEAISITIDSFLILNKKATRLIIEGFNLVAEAFNQTLGKLGAETIELINLDALNREIAELDKVLSTAGRDLADAFFEPFRATFREAEQRKLLDFFNKNVRRKPEREIAEEIEEAADKGSKAKSSEQKAFDDLLRDLGRENDLLKLNNAERQIQAALFDARDALDKKLNDTQKTTVENLIKENIALTKQREILDAINIPLTDYELTLKELNTLLGKAAISQKEFTTALRDSRIEFLDTQNDLASGVERAFLKMARDSEDVATEIESSITRAFDNAGDALADFVSEGKADFAGLIDSIIRDLARLAIQGAIINPIANALGLGGTGIGDEDPLKGAQGLFNRLFGSKATEAGPAALPAAASLAEATVGGFTADPALTSMNAAVEGVTTALTTAAPAIEQVTSAAIPAAAAIGNDLVQSSVEAAVTTTAQTLTAEQLIASLGQLALVSDAASAALQRVAASGGLDAGSGGLQGVFDAIFPGGGTGPGPLPDAGGFAESFADGGQVGGGGSGAVPIMAHAGEVILNKSQQQALVDALQTGKDPRALINGGKFGAFGSLIAAVAGFGQGAGGGNATPGRNALSGPIALGPDSALNSGFGGGAGINSPFEVFGAAAAAGGFGGLLRSIAATVGASLPGQAQAAPQSFAHGGVVGPNSASFTPPTSTGTKNKAGAEGGESVQVINQTWNIETQDLGGFNRTRHQIMGQAAGGVGAVRGRG